MLSAKATLLIHIVSAVPHISLTPLLAPARLCVVRMSTMILLNAEFNPAINIQESLIEEDAILCLIRIGGL